MPKEFQRIDRIAMLIQRELANLLQQEIRDPRLTLVTINRVEVSRDLAHAKIFVTQLSGGSSTNQALVIKTLNNASHHLRYLLANNLSLRVTPELRFFYDTSLEQALNLNQLIDKAVEKDENKTKN